MDAFAPSVKSNKRGIRNVGANMHVDTYIRNGRVLSDLSSRRVYRSWLPVLAESVIRNLLNLRRTVLIAGSD